MTVAPCRLLIALPGLHRVARGAEMAFENLGRELARRGDFAVTLAGGGAPRPGEPYHFVHLPLVPRERFERWPRLPPLRDEYRWEELTFAPRLAPLLRRGAFDATLTCSYPFVNWMLRLHRRQGRPRHLFVTQNGDWPAQRRNAEYRLFGCDGLVCTNPDYYERHRAHWRCALVPNGLDAARFTPGPSERAACGLPERGPVVLIASALIASKRVEAGLRAVAALPGVHLALAGDGPLRAPLDALAARLLPGRYTRLTLPAARMPALYRSADLLLHLSRVEAFGNIYIEALACGLPVVAHDSAVTRWILAPHGRLIDTADADALAGALRAELALPADPAAAAARHAAAAARFAWPVVAAGYAAFIHEVGAA